MKVIPCNPTAAAESASTGDESRFRGRRLCKIAHIEFPVNRIKSHLAENKPVEEVVNGTFGKRQLSSTMPPSEDARSPYLLARTAMTAATSSLPVPFGDVLPIDQVVRTSRARAYQPHRQVAASRQRQKAFKEGIAQDGILMLSSYVTKISSFGLVPCGGIASSSKSESFRSGTDGQ
jgi:hypothetical protein